MNWKELIHEYAPFNEHQSNKSLIKKFSKAEKPSRFAYNILILKILKTPQNSQQKWQSYDWFDHTRIWSNIYHLPYACTDETRLLSFQYNILHRAIFTNSKLFKANIHGTILCTFCNIQFETIEHLFFSCNITRNLYLQFSNWINENTNIEIIVEPCNFIFGVESSTNNNNALNNLILLCKKYVYIERCKGSLELNLRGLQNYIKYRISVEKTSLKNCGTNTFEEKWKNFKNFLW